MKPPRTKGYNRDAIARKKTKNHEVEEDPMEKEIPEEFQEETIEEDTAEKKRKRKGKGKRKLLEKK